MRGNNVYVGFMDWSNFTATKCRGLVSLNQVIKEIICLQPLKCGDLCLVLLLAVLLLLLLVASCLNFLEAVKKLLFFFQEEDGIRDHCVTGVQTCALPI